MNLLAKNTQFLLMTTTTTSNETKFISKEGDKYELTTLRTTPVTISDRNFSMPSKPDLQNIPKNNHSGNIGTKNNGIHFGNIMSDSLEYLKKMLGLTPDCINGGMKTLRGECICPKFYRGDLCEELICINNGTLVKTQKLAQYTCRCPYPEFIYGQHCEHVKCLNGGRPMDNGHCKCLDYWYTGQFCQEYAASWGVVLGLPLLCMVIIIICCVVCRMDLFPRKPVSRRRRGAPLNGVFNEGISHRRSGFEENLLNDNGESALVLRPHSYFFPSYIIHLDAMPVLNPTLSTNANSLKPFDPPPSYEEAVAAFSASQQHISGATVPPE
ncbi:unnamed protein product [Onchocerca ochengi]|uniref:EGF-like domain-containing protein n=2 Tax=Onchocerca TaxID=6281 RepID=A0A182EMP8_ONCOC|nr:unnamed protein product [Onchocerca ochengi]